MQLPNTLARNCASNKYTIKQLSEIYNCSETSIRKLILIHNLPYKSKNPRSKVDDNYFKSINTEDKAYFLGLLYADGCVHNSKKNEKTIALALTDFDLVNTFKKYIKAEAVLQTYRYKNTNYKDNYIIKIKSEQLFDDLIELGCVERKSLILTFPSFEQVPEYLIHHFIRGYFDGDGSIYIKNYRKASVSFAGTFLFLDKIKTILKELVGINSSLFQAKTIHILSISGSNQILKFRDFLYKSNLELFLHRKFERFSLLEEEQLIRNQKRYLKL